MDQKSALNPRNGPRGVRLIETEHALFFGEYGILWLLQKATKPLQGVFGWLRLTPHPTTPKKKDNKNSSLINQQPRTTNG